MSTLADKYQAMPITEKVILIVNHYTILDLIQRGNTKLKQLLTEPEAAALIASITSEKDKRIYNQYVKVNTMYVKGLKELYTLKLAFEKALYQVLYEVTLLTDADKKPNPQLSFYADDLTKRQKNAPAPENEITEHYTINARQNIDLESLKGPYLAFFNYYGALKTYGKVFKCKNKYYLRITESYVKELKKIISTLLNTEHAFGFLESDYNPEQIKHILLNDFNYNNE